MSTRKKEEAIAARNLRRRRGELRNAEADNTLNEGMKDLFSRDNTNTAVLCLAEGDIVQAVFSPDDNGIVWDTSYVGEDEISEETKLRIQEEDWQEGSRQGYWGPPIHEDTLKEHYSFAFREGYKEGCAEAMRIFDDALAS